MLVNVLSVAVGFALLVWSADRFITGAAATARNLGVAPLIIGLTIVGFGTSAPEMLVSAMAAWQGNLGLSIGNAIGSNITNIALVLGATAVIAPLNIHSVTVRREFPALLLTMALALALLWDLELSMADGVILLTGLALLVTWITFIGVRTRQTDPLGQEFDYEIPRDMSTARALIWLAIGLAVLLLSARMLVWGAVNIAVALGVSDLIIGLTIVALGTSLPELAASIMSALKHEHDIAIGNIIGSNLFNLLAVLGLPGLIGPGTFESAVIWRDFPIMVALTVALLLMAYRRRGQPGLIKRGHGLFLLFSYAGYVTLLYFSARATGA